MVADIVEEKKEIIARYRRLLRKAKPVLKEGDARLQRVYDSRGNIVEEHYFGVDGKPVVIAKNGAVLVRFLSWEWQFWLNVPLAIVGVTAAWWALAEHDRPEHGARIDWIGAKSQAQRVKDRILGIVGLLDLGNGEVLEPLIVDRHAALLTRRLAHDAPRLAVSDRVREVGGVVAVHLVG